MSFKKKNIFPLILLYFYLKYIDGSDPHHNIQMNYEKNEKMKDD